MMNCKYCGGVIFIKVGIETWHFQYGGTKRIQHRNFKKTSAVLMADCSGCGRNTVTWNVPRSWVVQTGIKVIE